MLKNTNSALSLHELLGGNTPNYEALGAVTATYSSTNPFTPPGGFQAVALHQFGTDGHDSMTGRFSRDDVIHAGAGNDTVSGNGSTGAGDRLYGQEGNDLLIAGRGTAVVDGGADIDTAVLDFSTASKALNFTVTPNATIHVDGGAGLQMQITSIECVNFTGGSYGDTIKGGVLNDTIDGGGGADKLWGGAGSDIFILRAGQANGDHIMDFNAALDRIEFHGYEAGAKLRKYVSDGANETDPNAAIRWDIYSDADYNLVLDSFYCHAMLQADVNYFFI